MHTRSQVDITCAERFNSYCYALSFVTSIGLSEVGPAFKLRECWYLSLLWSSILCLRSADKVARLTCSLSLLLANLTSLSCGVSSAYLSLYSSRLLRNLSCLSITCEYH